MLIYPVMSHEVLFGINLWTAFHVTSLHVPSLMHLIQDNTEECKEKKEEQEEYKPRTHRDLNPQPSD